MNTSSELNVACVVCGLRLDLEHSRTHLESVEEAKRSKEVIAEAQAERAAVRALG